MRAALALSLVLAGCTAETVPREGAPLPPMDDTEAMAAIYGDQVSELGLRITTARRFEEGDKHVPPTPSPTGTHLAICTEPATAFTTSRYASNVAPLFRIFQDVLERWPGLTSFDVCQEAIEPVAPEELPIQVTHVRLAREHEHRLNWERLDLAAIIDAALEDPPALAVYFSRLVRGTAEYRRAYEEARTRAPGPPSP